MNDILFAFLLVVVCILLAIALNYIFEKLDEKNRINNFLKSKEQSQWLETNGLGHDMVDDWPGTPAEGV